MLAALGVKGKPLEVARKLCFRLRVPQQNGAVAYHDLLKELIEKGPPSAGRAEPRAGQIKKQAGMEGRH